MKKAFFIILIPVFVIITLLIGFPYYTSTTIIDWEIISKEVKKTDWVDIYLVFIRDNEWNSNTYKIDDNIWYMQFSSSNLYGQLKEGDIVDASYYWVRIPFFSKYQNIYDIKVKQNGNDKLKAELQKYTETINSDLNKDKIYFFNEWSIYQYDIKNKQVEIYDENIFKKK